MVQLLIENIETLILNDDKGKNFEGVKITFSSVMIWEDFEKLKKESIEWNLK